jgi:TonB family protein
MNARTLLLLIVLPAIPAGLLLGQDAPKAAIQKSDIQTRAEALMEKARKLSDIRAKNAPFFRIKATFSFVGKDLENEQGTYTETWVSDSQWRREIVIGNVHRLEVGTPNRIWRLDNSKDFPATATRLADLMNIFPSPATLFEFESIADNTDQKPAEQCATTKPGAQQEKYRFCFEQKSGALLAKLSPDIRPKNMTDYTCFYGIFRKFGDFWFPREMACLEDKHRRLEAKVEDLSAEPSPDATQFTPPAGAIELGSCLGTLVHAVATLTPSPGFPTGSQGVNSSTSLSLIVDMRGKPQQITVNRSGGKAFDEHAVAAVERWRFKPATCDGEPMPAEFRVEVEFHH